jgi:hypothetical protein
MADLSEFKQYYLLADRLIEESSKEDLAECARVLALNVAHYQGKFGEIPLEETLAILDASEPNEEQAAILRGGMEIIVGLLGNVMSGLGEEKH